MRYQNVMAMLLLSLLTSNLSVLDFRKASQWRLACKLCHGHIAVSATFWAAINYISKLMLLVVYA